MKKILVRGYNHGRIGLNACELLVSTRLRLRRGIMKKTVSFVVVFVASALAFLALDVAFLSLQGLSFIFKG